MVRIKMITLEDVLEMQVNDEPFTFVEALPRDHFDEGHLPGAVNIPLNQVDKLAPDLLDKGDTVVVYCASYACKASTHVTRKLLELGYRNVLDYKGGKKEWKREGFKLETA